MITNDKVLDVVTSLCQYDIDTLLGTYKPFGAHGNVIYSYLTGKGILDNSGNITEFGQEVVNYLKDFYGQA